MLSIRENLPILYPRGGRKFDVAHLCLKGALPAVRRRDGSTVGTTPRRDLQLRLLYPAGGKRDRLVPVDILSKATHFNRGRHKLRFKAIGDGGLEVRLTIADGRWNKGGSGRFVVRFRRDGNSCTGSYTGTFEGVGREGEISGPFAPAGLTKPSKAPPVANELTRRCDAVIGDLAAALVTSSRVSPQGGTDIRRLVRRLYAAAAEVAQAVEARK